MNDVKKTIGWADYTINPVKGLCPMACSYCYARSLYKRFKWNPEIRFQYGEFHKLPSTPARVFIGSTMEMFGSWIKDEWLHEIFDRVRINRRHTFIFLTKQPQNLIKWSPFPDNCWVGVSATNEMMAAAGIAWLSKVRASVKFLSLEPLLTWNSENASNSIIRWHPEYINWVIIGQQTPVRLSTMPKVGWVEDMVTACDKANIPVFLKDNLISCVDQYEFSLKDGKLRREFPSLHKFHC